MVCVSMEICRYGRDNNCVTMQGPFDLKQGGRGIAQKDRVIIHTGHLAGRLLADVLLADLMENTEVIQPQALPAAA